MSRLRVRSAVISYSLRHVVEPGIPITILGDTTYVLVVVRLVITDVPTQVQNWEIERTFRSEEQDHDDPAGPAVSIEKGG